MSGDDKPKLAMYWAAACGGCEISVLNIAEKILDVDAVFDVVFWPVATDFKYADLRAYPDGYIDLCLFNGAIRTSENEEIAHLLRQKSKILVAFGSCASSGGIPGSGQLDQFCFHILALPILITHLLITRMASFPVRQRRSRKVRFHIPTFYPTVKKLQQVVDIDYTMPGCPPEPHQIWAVLQVVVAALQKGAPLPPKGAVIGAADVAVCKECSLEKHEKQITRFYRPYEIVPQPGLCLLEQGLVCLGPATRGGCGALCPQVGMGCRGCYGPLDDIEDQGARILAALSSVVLAGEPKEDEARDYQKDQRCYGYDR